jgi:hypothetical protein
MSKEMLELKDTARSMTVDDFDTHAYIELNDDCSFWLNKDRAYKLFWWLGEWLDMPMENLEE